MQDRPPEESRVEPPASSETAASTSPSTLSPGVAQPSGPQGLARGRWEAPKWAFYAAFGAALSVVIVYFLFRLVFKRRARAADARDPKGTAKR